MISTQIRSYTIRKTSLKMVRTSLSQNNGNKNNNSVTSAIKDSVTPVNGKCAKPSVNGTTNGSAKSLQPSSSSSYINGTQHHKEVESYEYIDMNEI